MAALIAWQQNSWFVVEYQKRGPGYATRGEYSLYAVDEADAVSRTLAAHPDVVAVVSITRFPADFTTADGE